MKPLRIATRCLCLLALPLLAGALPPTSPGRSSSTPAAAPALQPFAFLSGRWVEDSTDGWEEEYWSPATGSSMVGHFRVVKDGQPVFYEFWAIEIEDGKPVFKMKHFNQNLQGWEEKVDMVRLPGNVSGPNDALFARPDSSLALRYQRKGDELVSWLRRVKNGKTIEEAFHLHRAKE